MGEHTKSLLQALIDSQQLGQLRYDGEWRSFEDWSFYALCNVDHGHIRVKQPTIRIGEGDVAAVCNAALGRS